MILNVVNIDVKVVCTSVVALVVAGTCFVPVTDPVVELVTVIECVVTLTVL